MRNLLEVKSKDFPYQYNIVSRRKEGIIPIPQGEVFFVPKTPKGIDDLILASNKEGYRLYLIKKIEREKLWVFPTEKKITYLESRKKSKLASIGEYTY